MNIKSLFIMAPIRKSWVGIPDDCDFSIDNIPFGVCSFPKAETMGFSLPIIPTDAPRCCTAIGEYAVDLHLLAEAGLLDGLCQDEDMNSFHPRIVFSRHTLNDFMAADKSTWTAVRNRLISLFLEIDGGAQEHEELTPDSRLKDNLPLRNLAMRPLDSVTFHLPATIGDYTDFYSSREHATNVGIMFRGKDNALQPNWLHMPIGYHGRSSSIFASGVGGKMATIRRPCGQLQLDASDPLKGSTYGPCKLMDFELEVAFFVGGTPNYDSTTRQIGRPMTLDEAKDRIFGYVLMNDWSARDIQKWEYVPLGPFTSKNFATTISPWIVTPMALEPFRCETSAGKQGGGGFDTLSGPREDPVPLDYLQDPNYG
jgi:fumarylacetoacetase